jgi:hypothetical protein
LLVNFGAWAVNRAHDVGHTGLVRHESSQVRGGFGIVAWERTNAALVATGTLPWKEPKGPVAWSFKLTVRHVVSFGFVLFSYLNINFKLIIELVRLPEPRPCCKFLFRADGS